MEDFFEAHVLKGYVVVSEELLMDCGVIPDTRKPIVISKWRKLRWRLEDMRESFSIWAYKVLSGSHFPDVV